MIEQAEITNFQSHRSTLFIFHSGVNIIKGDNHSGKSAAMRALNWALRNRPKGDGFVSDFAEKGEETATSLAFSEGAWIKRKRLKGVNSYETSESDESFLAIRSDVPSEIATISKLNSENIQSQRERYFFLEDTPGQIAKKWNSIVGLEIIDEKRTQIKTIITDTNSKIKLLEQDIKSLDAELKETFYVNDAFGIIRKTDDLLNEREIKNERLETVKAINKNIRIDENFIKESEGLVKLSGLVCGTEKLIIDKAQIVDKLESVLDIYDDIVIDEKCMEKSLLLINLKDSVGVIEKLIEKRSQMVSKKTLLSSLYEDIGRNEKALKNAHRGLKSMNDRMVALESQLNYCRYCGASKEHWNKDKIDNE